MTRFLAITVACLVVFATTGLHRAAASLLETPHNAPVQVVTAQASMDHSKTPCCKSYKVYNDNHASACSLPLVTLPPSVELTSSRNCEDAWLLRSGPPLVGLTSGPGEQPPKYA